MAGDRVTTGMDAVVVRVTADDGSVGIGESGTVGVTFDAQHLPGQIAGISHLAPAIVGMDPRSPQAVHRRMQAAMTGHPYCKSPIDIAVWDLAARAAGQPLWQRLGGDGPEPTPLYRPVQGATPDDVRGDGDRTARPGLPTAAGEGRRRSDHRRPAGARRARGGRARHRDLRRCELRVLAAAARRFVRELGPGGAGVFLEQPCATLVDCAHLRSSWDGPMVMDESITSLAALIEAHRLGVADGVTVKLTRVGGITPALTHPRRSRRARHRRDGRGRLGLQPRRHDVRAHERLDAGAAARAQRRLRQLGDDHPCPRPIGTAGWLPRSRRGVTRARAQARPTLLR